MHGFFDFYTANVEEGLEEQDVFDLGWGNPTKSKHYPYDIVYEIKIPMYLVRNGISILQERFTLSLGDDNVALITGYDRWERGRNLFVGEIKNKASLKSVMDGMGVGTFKY